MKDMKCAARRHAVRMGLEHGEVPVLVEDDEDCVCGADLRPGVGADESVEAKEAEHGYVLVRRPDPAADPSAAGFVVVGRPSDPGAAER
jgi:hypothetical protein